MLAQVALLAVVFCGLLSLLVDVGFSRLTQTQMQTAADAAALEGLRKRDIGIRNGANGPVVNDPFASDCIRRASASRLVGWTFDDDFDRSNGDGGYRFGAGPVAAYSDGFTTLHAGRTFDLNGSGVYEPDLQLNQQNNVHGDMVSGRFCYTTDPAPSEGGAYEVADIVCGVPQRGQGPFSRLDFNPSASAPLPPAGLDECPAPDDPVPNPWPAGGTGSLDTADDSAFLVRLRRGHDLDDAGGLEPGVASSGPALPLTFGQATTVSADPPSGGYSIRRDGISVRATAIARVRPALRVGLPNPATGVAGVTPFALVDTFTATLTPAGVPVTINPGTGSICAGVVCGPATPTVGRFVDALTDPTRARWTLAATVGRPLPAAVPLTCPGAAIAGFGPVVSALASGAVRVIGFARLTMGPDPARPGNPCARILQRAASLVAPANATAVLAGGLPLPPTASLADLHELVDKNLVRAGRVNYAPVLVPVLGR